MKSNAACANPSSVTSNVISMKVTISSPATMSIAGVTAVNAGQSSRITSVVVNGGTNPAYQWQDSTSTYTWRDIAGGASAGIDYKPRQTGDKLRCRLSSSGSCIADPVVYSNTLTFAVSPVTAINTVPASSLGIRIYPNPVTSIFTIDSLRVNENWLSLDIMSMDGKHKLLTKMTGHQSRLTVDVSHLPAGYYLVLLKRKSGKTAYLKFVKL
jgi:hypothetical protein